MDNRKNKKRIQNAVYVLVAAFLAVILSLSAFSLYQLGNQKELVISLYNSEIDNMAHLTRIRQAITNGIELPVNQAISGDISFKEASRALAYGHFNLDKEFQQYFEMENSKDELQDAMRIKVMVDNDDGKFSLIQKVLKAEDRPALNAMIEELVDPTFDAIDKLVQSLIDRKLAKSKAAVGEIASVYSASKKNLLFFFIICILTILPVFYYLFNRISNVFRILELRGKLVAESEQKFRNLFDYAGDAILLLDTEGNIKNVNNKTVEMLHFSREELLKLNVKDLCLPSQFEKVQANWQMLCEFGEMRDETLLGRKDGSLVVVDKNCRIMPGGNDVIVILRDISVRKQYEELIRLQHEQLEIFVKYNPCALAMFDMDMNYLAISDKWQEIFDLVGKQVVGHNHYNLLKFYAVNRRKFYEQALSGTEVSQEDDMIISKNGGNLWNNWKAMPWKKADGSIGGIIVLFEDITEKKRATDLFKRQFNNSPDTIVVLNTEGIIEDINKRIGAEMDTSKYKGLKYVDCVPEANRFQTVFAFEQCVNNKSPVEFDMALENNRWSHIRIIPLVTNGVFEKVMIFSTDISKAKNAERSFAAEKVLLDSIINSLPGIFYLRDDEGNLLRWNKNAEELVGYNPEIMKNPHMLDYVGVMSQSDAKKIIENTNEAGHSERVIFLKAKDGTNIPFLIYGRRVMLQRKSYTVGIGLDISDRMASEKAMEESRDQIRKLSIHLEKIQEEERTRIAREIHDDLGQHLAGIKMDASWLIKNKNAEETQREERMNDMMELLNETISIVRRISTDLRPGILDDLGLIPALEWFGQNFQKRTGILSQFYAEIPDVQIETQLGNNIFRVYQEALTNVMKYSSATVVNTTITLKENNEICLTVLDNGVGFDKEAVKSKGSHGLIGMKERAFIFNGTLDILTSPGKGTQVKLTVPIQIQPDNSNESTDR